MFYLERFLCNHEGFQFEVTTDYQGLKYLCASLKLKRREARWIEKLGIFGIFPISLKPEEIHVHRDVLSRISNEEAVLIKVEVPCVDFSNLIVTYDDDQFLGPIL